VAHEKHQLEQFMHIRNFESVHPAYNPSFLAYFFSRNSIFLSQQISQQCFSAGLSAEPNGAFASLNRAPRAEKS
jgi:hypothetical protein